jgi:hypothetical protein
LKVQDDWIWNKIANYIVAVKWTIIQWLLI